MPDVNAEKKEAILVHIDNEAENTFVAKLDPGEDLWIGLEIYLRSSDYALNERVYFWTDTQRRAHYTNWHRGESASPWSLFKEVVSF